MINRNDKLFEVEKVSTELKSNEWYTPSKYIEAARTVMNGIDLDPASCEMANQTVRATRYYDQAMNGLAQPWYGRVWLNPPYGVSVPKGHGRYKGGGSSSQNKSLQTLFVSKALQEFCDGKIEQAILLVTANITCSWFQPLWAYPLCIPYPKPTFFVPGLSQRQRQVFGNTFAYLGPNEPKFIDIFSEFGTVVKRVSPPKPVAQTLWEHEP